jgi:hypothetical protein
MDRNDDIQLHGLEQLERNLATEKTVDSDDTVSAETSPNAFMIVSPSGFMIVSPSGFMIV